MNARDAIKAQRAQVESEESEERYREVRRKELARQVPDLRRRETIIQEEIAALRRRAQHPKEFVPQEERSGET